MKATFLLYVQGADLVLVSYVWGHNWQVVMTVFQCHTERIYWPHNWKECTSAFTTKRVRDVECRVSKCYRLHFKDTATGAHSHANERSKRRQSNPGVFLGLCVFPGEG